MATKTKAPAKPRKSGSVKGIPAAAAASDNTATDAAVTAEPSVSPAEHLNAILSCTHRLPAEKQENAHACVVVLGDAVNGLNENTKQAGIDYNAASDTVRNCFVGHDDLAALVNAHCSKLHQMLISEAPADA